MAELILRRTKDNKEFTQKFDTEDEKEKFARRLRFSKNLKVKKNKREEWLE